MAWSTKSNFPVELGTCSWDQPPRLLPGRPFGPAIPAHALSSHWAVVSLIISQVKLLAPASAVVPCRFTLTHSPLPLEVPPVLKSQSQLPVQNYSPEPQTENPQRLSRLPAGMRSLPSRPPVSCWLAALQPNTVHPNSRN